MIRKLQHFLTLPDSNEFLVLAGNSELQKCKISDENWYDGILLHSHVILLFAEDMPIVKHSGPFEIPRPYVVFLVDTVDKE